MKRLLGIEEHNSRVLSKNHDMTGIACPNCDAELDFKEPGVLMLSRPPQANVICFSCGYQSRIYV
jgi:hypothetical protein